jgi:hypothetical protein
MKIPRLLVCGLLAAFVALLLVFSLKNVRRLLNASPSLTTDAAQKTTNNLVSTSSFRISETSTVNADRHAGSADAAYNADDNEYLVVWESDGLTEVKGVSDIYGQRLSGATNERIGIAFRISSLTDRDKNHGSNRPRVSYNRTSGEYLVVWNGSGRSDSPDRFFEVYGQRLSRNGKVIGNTFRISYATDLGKVNTSFVRGSSQVDAAWNSASNEYMVIWKGMGEPEDVVKMEVYGQRLKPSGELLGKAFRISHTTDQGININANAPAIAYNSRDNQYFVVWSGGFKNESQVEVWGTGLSAAGESLRPKNEFRISHVVEVGANRRATSPRIIYNKSNNEYLVVFQANALSGQGNEDVNEIFGQRIDAATLAETGASDFRISNAASPFNNSSRPAVALNTVANEYLVIWRAARQSALYEISGQRISAAGIEIDADFQISNMASVGKDRTANNPSLALNTENGKYFVVWQGNGLPSADAEKTIEIFGQKLELARSLRQ